MKAIAHVSGKDSQKSKKAKIVSLSFRSFRWSMIKTATVEEGENPKTLGGIQR